MTNHNALQSLCSKYAELFEEGLGTLKGFEARIHVDPKAPPKFCRARVIPYAFRDQVNKELDRLVEQGTIVPIDVSEWACTHSSGFETG